MTSPPAGWYPDPYDETQLRYWDGAAWTDSVSPAAAAAGPAPGTPAGGFEPPVEAAPEQGWETPAQEPASWEAPAQGGQSWESAGQGTPSWDTPAQQWESPPYQASYGAGAELGHGYGDIGEWLGKSFNVLFKRIVPLLVLLIAIPAAAFIVVAVLVGLVINGISIDNTGIDPQVEGFSGGLVALAIVAFLAALVVAGAAYIGAHHQLYAAHIGEPQGIGQSMSTGLRRIPRLILWALVGFAAYIAFVIAFVVLFAIVGLIASDSGAVGGLLVFLIVIGAIVGGIWLLVRLSFFWVALAVGPAGTNPFTASFEATRDRFWATLGRLILLFIMLFVIGILLNIVVQGALVSSAASEFSVDSDGDLLIDGEPADNFDTIDLGDFIPGLGWFVALAIFSVISQAVQQGIAISAQTRLYAEAGGSGEV